MDRHRSPVLAVPPAERLELVLGAVDSEAALHRDVGGLAGRDLAVQRAAATHGAGGYQGGAAGRQGGSGATSSVASLACLASSVAMGMVDELRLLPTLLQHQSPWKVPCESCCSCACRDVLRA